MSKKVLISEAPFIYAKADTTAIMADVLIALIPTLACGIYLYGISMLTSTLICIAACILFEALFEKLVHRPVTVKDLSAAVTGAIIALNLPADVSPRIAILGCFIAIVVVKQLFGGIGRNFANPALVAIIVLYRSFPADVNHWIVNSKMIPAIYDAANGAQTGLTVLQLQKVNGDLPTALQMLTGFKNGPVANAWAIAAILGGVYLIAKKIISPVLPAAFLATVCITSLFQGSDPLFQICAGGVMFYAFFMANDYTTMPVTALGKLAAGVILGVITMFFRAYSSVSDGIVYALLFVNILTPRIDALTMPRPFGKMRGGKADE